MGKFGFRFGYPMDGALMAPTSRYFTTLDGSADYFTIPTVTLTGDFSIEVDISTTYTTAAQYIIGNNTDDNMYVRVDATTGVIAVNCNSTKTIVGTVDISDGKLHTIKLTNVSGTATLYIDDVSDGTVASLSGNNVIDRIGDNHTASTFFNGVIANVKITDAGTLIRDYKVNEDWNGTTTLIDYGSDGSDGTAVSITSANAEQFTLIGADWVGVEMLSNPNFTSDTVWVKGVGYTISSNAMHVNANGTFSYDTTATFAYQPYLVGIVVSNYVSGAVNAAPHGTTVGTDRTANGSYTEIISASSGGNEFFIKAVGVTVCDVESVSCKRILQAP